MKGLPPIEKPFSFNCTAFIKIDLIYEGIATFLLAIRYNASLQHKN